MEQREDRHAGVRFRHWEETWTAGKVIDPDLDARYWTYELQPKDFEGDFTTEVTETLRPWLVERGVTDELYREGLEDLVAGGLDDRGLSVLGRFAYLRLWAALPEMEALIQDNPPSSDWSWLLRQSALALMAFDHDVFGRQTARESADRIRKRVRELAHALSQGAQDYSLRYGPVLPGAGAGSSILHHQAITEEDLLEFGHLELPGGARWAFPGGAYVQMPLEPYLLELARRLRDYEPEPISAGAANLERNVKALGAYVRRYLKEKVDRVWPDRKQGLREIAAVLATAVLAEPTSPQAISASTRGWKKRESHQGRRPTPRKAKK